MLSRRNFIISSGSFFVVCHTPGTSILAYGAEPILPSPSLIPPTPDIFRSGIIREETEVNLYPALLQSLDRPLLIWADTVRLSGNYKTNGKSFGLVARKLIVDSGTSISTEGNFENVVNFLPNQLPSPPSSAGENGKNGTGGGSGIDGGHFYMIAESISGDLIIDASGTNGGDGQTGGAGAKGKNGRHGGDCQNGSNGGRGGNAGLGGAGGLGGSGGRILLSTRNNSLDGLTGNSSLGLGGKGGGHGKPGGGGNRGNKGKRTYTWDRRDP